MPTVHRLITLLCVVCLLPASGCQKTSPVELPPLSFTQYLPIHINVSSIELIEEYKPPMELPNVEHLIPYSPTEAMEIWAQQRLRTVGMENKLEILVKNGAVTVHQEPFESGWPSFFTGLPDKRYEAVLDVEMRAYEPGSAMSRASIRVRARRSIIINDSATPLQRDAAFRRMITELMTMINAQLEKNMFQYMSNYISFSHTP